MEVRRRIEVSGIVQGVGFRPYIYRLATGRHLSGTIRNTSAGVTIEIQGPIETVQDFIDRLPAEAPPLARITGFTVDDVAWRRCQRRATASKTFALFIAMRAKKFAR